MREVEFEIGQVVRLMSGGPAMTIEKIDNSNPYNETIRCIWFDEINNLHRSCFVPDVLVVHNVFITR